ncbi:MAG: RNA polymerase sigma factor [Clostridia bacterium]|nr:RNA polymerase sigma factor [Clostridia bacterium]
MKTVPDSSVMERWVNEYGDNLLRVCALNLGDASQAEDALQETLLKAFRAYGSFQHQSSEKTWLTRIAINVCRDMQRSRWFRFVDRRVDIDEMPEPAMADELPDDSVSLEIMKLPHKYREIIILHFYQQMRVEEIAETLEVPRSTVSSRLKRAKDKLREQLEGWYFDETNQNANR